MRLPGLMDPHVHMREPGATHKEDWESGTAAALAGGFTQILAMPNTQPPILDGESLGRGLALARAKARCDFGLFLGAASQNAASAADAAGKSAGLKLYLDQTFGPLRLESVSQWVAHFKMWPRSRPVVAHAEGPTLPAVILMAALFDRPLHIAHVASREAVLIIRAAKERGLKITCEAAPQHLFLTQADVPPGWCEVRPRLGTSEDVAALWENLAVIDCFATDHAPHTREEKGSPNPPPGFPGLETALPLFLTAVAEGRLDWQDLIPRLSENTRRIFGLRTQPQTWLEVDLDARFEIRTENLNTRAGWTPFEGFRGRGLLRRVVLRGKTVFEDGRVLAVPGSGRPLVYAG